MKRAVGILLFWVVALSCSAQLTIPMGGSSPSSGNTTRKGPRNSRTLVGTILDKADKPVPEAIVYLKNMKTLAVKTYISQNDGNYRFPELSTNADYEIYAQKNGSKSSTKTLSQFDDRDKATINLAIDTSKMNAPK